MRKGLPTLLVIVALAATPVLAGTAYVYVAIVR